MLAVGGNPDAAGRPVPAGLARAIDLSRVGGFGHSLGTPTVVGAMNRDRRIDTGLALDGDLDLPDPGRPFLMMGNEQVTRAGDPEWAAFYDRLTALRRHLVLIGSRHADFGDVGIWKETIDLVPVFGEQFGPIDGRRALAVQRRYLAAWFDRVLRGRPSPLLRGENARFPEIDFQP